MIDFSLSENDQLILREMRSQSLVCRKYARYYDEHEDEFPPDRLPEAVDFRNPYSVVTPCEELDTPRRVMHMLVSAAQAWGDYGVMMQRGKRSLGNLVLDVAGTPEQQQRWGGMTLAIAITEPGCGSDAKSLRTSAVRVGDEWVLNGEKIFVTTGCRCDGVVVAATLDRNAGHRSIHPFVVLKGTPGFQVAYREKKLGIRADDTATMVFQDARIPQDHLLGGDEKSTRGFNAVMSALNATRPAVGIAGLGIARAALDFTREQFMQEGIEVDWGVGRSARSAIQQELIEIDADIEAALLNMLYAAWLSDGAKWQRLETTVAKAKSGEVARSAVRRCLDLLGGLGISHEYLMEKWFRDARITDLYGGTGEIQRLIIAREILGYSSAELT
jgi:acyl-CoA dehydrogenase